MNKQTSKQANKSVNAMWTFDSNAEQATQTVYTLILECTQSQFPSAESKALIFHLAQPFD